VGAASRAIRDPDTPEAWRRAQNLRVCLTCHEHLGPGAGARFAHLLATQIPTQRRVPIASSFSCARALTFLLQAVEREKTWEALARRHLFPGIALAAQASGGKATRSSSTQ